MSQYSSASAALPSPLPQLRRRRPRRSAYDKRTLDMIERLSRVVEAMAADTQWHTQMFELVADIQDLRLDIEATRIRGGTTHGVE